MVVLDGHNMLGAGPHQYLQPDYLSPLPTTLDAKKSPLALLAQTCSQIGADSPSTKSLLPTIHESVKRKSSSSSDTSSLKSDTDVRDTNSRPRSSGSNCGASSSAHNGKSSSGNTSGHGKSSPAFKPYENSTSSSGNNKYKSEDMNREKSRTPKSFANSGSCSPAKISRTSPPVTSSTATSSSSSSSSTSASATATSSTTTTSASANESSSTSSNNPSNSKSSSSSNHPTTSSWSSTTSSLSPADGKHSPNQHPKTSSPIDQGASPIIRSGLEVLQGHLQKDYAKSGAALSSLSALAGYPPGFDPTNPALRPSFFAPPHHPMSGGHFMGYPPSTGSPYVGYTRVKTPSGAETIVPVCKDPYCTGCQFGSGAAAAAAASGMNGLMAAAAAAGFPGLAPSSSQSGGICPAGCVQCDHQKFSLAAFHSPFGMGPPGLSAAAAALGYPQSLLSQHAAAAAAAAQHQHQQQQQHQQAQAQQHAQRPYVCNWIVGDTYCGKRFPSSEELLVHLRTHTNLSNSSGSASDAAAVVAAAQQQQLQQLSNSSLYSSALLSSSAAAAAGAAMHRTYPTPPLSPLSAARYHPYANAGAKVPTSLSSLMPVPSNLGNYYPSPYSIYGQRIGPPVHP